MDTGGRATHGAVAEEILNKHLLLFSCFLTLNIDIHPDVEMELRFLLCNRALEVPDVGYNYTLDITYKNGGILYGDKNYKINIPANVPVKGFWSVVAYDPQTRSQLQTDQSYPSKNNKRDKLIENKDGSVDLYFGPKPPKSKETNRIQTEPTKAWFVLFRLNGSLQP